MGMTLCPLPGLALVSSTGGLKRVVLAVEAELELDTRYEPFVFRTATVAATTTAAARSAAPAAAPATMIQFSSSSSQWDDDEEEEEDVDEDEDEDDDVMLAELLVGWEEEV